VTYKIGLFIPFEYPAACCGVRPRNFDFWRVW